MHALEAHAFSVHGTFVVLAAAMPSHSTSTELAEQRCSGPTTFSSRSRVSALQVKHDVDAKYMCLVISFAVFPD